VIKKTTRKSDKTSRKQVDILGIRVDSTSKARVITAVEEKISHNDKFYIVTPNPELILASTKDKKLKEALNSADFAIPDGFGLKAAEPSLRIIKGRKLFEDLIALANKKGWRVFLLGGLGNEAEICRKKLENSYRDLKIESGQGPKLNKNARPISEIDRKIEIDIIARINQFKPHLLFVAFGNPKQEIWMHDRYKLLDVSCMMGVGGTFRYFAGLAPLPPKWIEKAGLEWLWRLLTEPFRFTRVLNAVVVFPLRVWQAKLFRIHT